MLFNQHNRIIFVSSLMSKAIKSLFVVCCFALASVSAQALACSEHADKASENSDAPTKTAEAACACGKEKSNNEKGDKQHSCDGHKEHHGEKSDHHKKHKS